MKAIFSSVRPVSESLLAGFIGLIGGAVFMLIFGYNPISAYIALFMGGFGDLYGFSGTLSHATPLILTALTFAIGLRGGLFNIGAEGQVYLGALAAVSMSYVHLPTGIHLIVTLIAAMLAGALWSIVPAILKVMRGVHEVISTIMFNWIAHFLAFYLVANMLVDPRRAEKTISILPSARFPLLTPGTSLSYGIFVSLSAAVVIYFFLWHTTPGFEIRAAGLNPDASRYAGMATWKTGILAFILGGFTAGLAGAVQIMGRPPTYAILTGMPLITNLGFDGLGVAMVGRNNPIGIIFAAIFFGGLIAGGRMMQLSAGVPLEMIRVVEGIMIVTLSIPELTKLFRMYGNRLFVWRRR